jgi:hypothetical protein
MGRITFAIYRAKPGRDKELLQLIEEHLPMLKAQNLVTDRTPIVMTKVSSRCLNGNHEKQLTMHTRIPKCKSSGAGSVKFVISNHPNISEFSEMFSEFEAIN